jgi:hypothetical protein
MAGAVYLVGNAMRTFGSAILKLAQVDGTAQDNQNIIGVRLWTEEEWLAHRDAQQGNSRLITQDVSDAVVIDEQDE